MLPSLTIASPDAIRIRCTTLRRADSLAQLRQLLLADIDTAGPDGPFPVLLDLVGPTTPGHHLLRLGYSVINLLDPPVARFFADLASSGLLARRRVAAVRLLGPETTSTDAGRRTIRMLAHALGRPVYGTLTPLLAAHWSPAGFNPAFRYLLAEASTLD
jgi:hypothetical protein